MSGDISTESILDYLKNLSNNINKTIELLETFSNKNTNISDTNNLAIENIDMNNYPENTLIISETDNKVILPFYYKGLKKILKKNHNKYSNLEEVIEDLYTIPLNYYKNSSISRFKEAFKLIREREHGSLKDAIELGIEVLTNYNLHPAIITACKNIHQFDIYLSCLEYNELEDFHFFDIKFKAPPAIVKPRKYFFKKQIN